MIDLERAEAVVRVEKRASAIRDLQLGRQTARDAAVALDAIGDTKAHARALAMMANADEALDAIAEVAGGKA